MSAMESVQLGGQSTPGTEGPGNEHPEMELEWHQLDQRYKELRVLCLEGEKRVLASLARHGQQVPVVVVRGGDDGRYILIDGYKRARALVRLRYDTVRATLWDMQEHDALVLERLIRSGKSDSALEQGWLLRELRDRFGLSSQELSQRFDRSDSWVSRRLGLVGELPQPIQEQVRQGRLVPHAAMKYLLPLARANRQGAIELAAAIAPLSPSTRQTRALCLAFARGGKEVREDVLSHPEAYLCTVEMSDYRSRAAIANCPAAQLLCDLDALDVLVIRAYGRIASGEVGEFLPPEKAELARRLVKIRGHVNRFLQTLEKELDNAGRTDSDSHSQAS